jgi:hypothetical protein
MVAGKKTKSSILQSQSAPSTLRAWLGWIFTPSLTCLKLKQSQAKSSQAIPAKLMSLAYN